MQLVHARNFLLLACLLAGLQSMPGDARAQVKEPVKVALVSSRTGNFAEMGEELVRGMRFAFDEANERGGVDGRKVLVAEGDDESNPEVARRVTEKLAREGHKFLIGGISSAVSLAIMQNLERLDALYFASISKSDRLTGDACRMRSFRTVQSDAMDFAMIESWSRKIPGKTYATIASDYVWGRESSESFKRSAEAQGKTVALSLFAPLGTKDFAPYITQLKNAKVDGIWVAIPGRDAVTFLNQAGSFGLVPGTQLLGHALLLNFMLSATGKVQEGMSSTVGYAANIDTPRNRAFVGAFQAKLKRPPTDTEGLGYHAATVLLEGVRLARSVDPAAVAQALRGARIDTVFGPLVMRRDDHQLLMPNFVGRARSEGGELRAIVEDTYPPSLVPPASAQCKM